MGRIDVQIRLDESKVVALPNPRPFKGWFGIQTPLGFFAKLENDFDRLRESPCDQYAAFDFFVTALHIIDWLYPNTEGADVKSTRNALERRGVLQICRHIGNGVKHFQLRDETLKSVRGTEAQAGAFAKEVFEEDIFNAGSLVIHLDPKAVEALKREEGFECVDGEIECVALARIVLAFWDRYFKKFAEHGRALALCEFGEIGRQ